MKKRNSKQIDNQIKNLQRRINKLKKEKIKVHNNDTINVSLRFSDKNSRYPTKCEEIFRDIAASKNINLEFQYPIYIYNGNKIDRFYIVDFCDVKNRIIIEIDGKYHDETIRRELDRSREYYLRRQGYGIHRITNDEVLAGKSTSFLYNIYKSRVDWSLGTARKL